MKNNIGALDKLYNLYSKVGVPHAFSRHAFVDNKGIMWICTPHSLINKDVNLFVDDAEERENILNKVFSIPLLKQICNKKNKVSFLADCVEINGNERVPYSGYMEFDGRVKMFYGEHLEEVEVPFNHFEAIMETEEAEETTIGLDFDILKAVGGCFSSDNSRVKIKNCKGGVVEVTPLCSVRKDLEQRAVIMQVEF